MSFCQDIQNDMDKYLQSRLEIYVTMYMKYLRIEPTPKAIRVTNTQT